MGRGGGHGPDGLRDLRIECIEKVSYRHKLPIGVSESRLNVSSRSETDRESRLGLDQGPPEESGVIRDRHFHPPQSVVMVRMDRETSGKSLD